METLQDKLLFLKKHCGICRRIHRRKCFPLTCEIDIQRREYKEEIKIYEEEELEYAQKEQSCRCYTN